MDIAGCWRYSCGYVVGFVSGLRENVLRPQPMPTVNQPDLDDPEVLLSLAQQEMKESQAKNRERAVRAITQKNILQAEVDKTQKMVNKLRMNADLARALGDVNEERLTTDVVIYSRRKACGHERFTSRCHSDH